MPFSNQSLLLLDNFSHGIHLIILFNRLFKCLYDLLMFFAHHFDFPERSSDGISFTFVVGAVNELGSLVEGHVVGADVDVSILAKHVILNSVDFETSFALAFGEEEDFVYFVQLV